MLMKSTEEELLAIFSNLFPLLIQDDHSKGLMEQKAYYGYSPYFRKLEQGQNHLNIQCGLRELKVVKSFLIDLKK
ncbi:MAG: hypothetical protein A2X57_05610 [Nitrospirae bacterium GWD2_57_8]|nr:MAG: hypothetical protein A2X57_05610 [Nitrospirae bacterium GWD2_57_8]